MRVLALPALLTALSRHGHRAGLLLASYFALGSIIRANAAPLGARLEAKNHAGRQREQADFTRPAETFATHKTSAYWLRGSTAPVGLGTVSLGGWPGSARICTLSAPSGGSKTKFELAIRSVMFH